MYSMNSIRTENCVSFHPGAHASAYYGDGGGRDFGIIRSDHGLHGTSQGGIVVESHAVGLPSVPPPIETVRGHPPGYTGFVPGRIDDVGDTYAMRTARFNSPRGDGSRRPPPHWEPFSTTAGRIGAGAEKLQDEDGEGNKAEKRVPPLSLGGGKNNEELTAEGMLTQNPPRAMAPRSQRFNTSSGFSATQLNMVRKLDLAAQTGNIEALAEHSELVIVHIPSAAQLLECSEERLRNTALSFSGGRLMKGDGALTGVGIPSKTWDAALNSVNS